MIEVVKELIERKELIDGVQKVILGYSGGPDSTFLREVLSYEKVGIILAYFNHNLRNDSEKEEEFVEKEANRLNLELRVEGGDVKKYCDSNALSIEEGARLLRMNYLRKVKKEESADMIALGHNLDDQVENFFIRLMRGSGFGLSSMRYRKDDILRPLLSIRKKNIIEYLDENNIPYYEDPSNKDLRYLRNKIRLELIPVIESIKGDSIKCILRSIENIKEMEEALKKNINDIHFDKYPNHIEVDRENFEQLEQSEKFLFFSKMLSFFDKKKELKRAHVEDLPEKGIIELSHSLIELTKDKLILTVKQEHSEKELPVDGRLSFGDFLITTQTIEKIDDTSKDGCEYFDLDKLELPLKVRVRKRGDNIISFGSKNKKKLKDIFINEKIPRTLRDLWPVLCDRKGVILIPGLRRSNRAIISNKTKKIIQIKYKEVKNGR
jgi:tRNA(Ile)-lysidine synthase